MFNKKLKQQIEVLKSDNLDLGKHAIELGRTLTETNLELDAYKAVTKAQGALITVFADYICNNMPKPKRKYVRKVNIEKPKAKRPGRPKLKHRGRPKGKKNVK